MRSPRRLLGTLAVTAACVLGMAVSASWSAEPEPVCPPNSQNPRCPSPSPGDSESPAPPQPTGRPTTPPGQEPGEPSPPAPGEPSPVPGPGSPTQPPSTQPPPPAEPPPLPPPPDLGPVRSFVTRVSEPAGAGAMVEVEVTEERARGVDGGWTVTIEAGALALRTVAAEADGASELLGAVHVRPALAAPGPRALFTVVGQSADGQYAGRYRAQARLEAEGGQALPTITVTLFQ